MLAGAVPSGHVSRVEPSPPCRLMGSGCPLPKEMALPGRGRAADRSVSPAPAAALALRCDALACAPKEPATGAGGQPCAGDPARPREGASSVRAAPPAHPACGLGEAEQVPWAGRSWAVAVFGRGLPKRGQHHASSLSPRSGCAFWTGAAGLRTLLAAAPHPASPRELGLLRALPEHLLPAALGWQHGTAPALQQAARQSRTVVKHIPRAALQEPAPCPSPLPAPATHLQELLGTGCFIFLS